MLQLTWNVEKNFETICSHGEFKVTGSQEFIKSVGDTIKEVQTSAPTIESLPSCVSYVASLRKEVKTYEDELGDIKKAWDAPLEKYLSVIANTVSSFKDAVKDYGDKVLDLKKQDFKNKAKARFVMLAGAMTKTGEIPDFDSFYEEAWYSRSKNNQDLDNFIIAKLRTQEEVSDESAVAMFTIKGSANIKKAEDLLIENRINYEKI
jgi:hypothetical protein